MIEMKQVICNCPFTDIFRLWLAGSWWWTSFQWHSYMTDQLEYLNVKLHWQSMMRSLKCPGQPVIVFRPYLQAYAVGILQDVVWIQVSKQSYKGDIITDKQTKTRNIKVLHAGQTKCTVVLLFLHFIYKAFFTIQLNVRGYETRCFHSVFKNKIRPTYVSSSRQRWGWSY